MLAPACIAHSSPSSCRSSTPSARTTSRSSSSRRSRRSASAASCAGSPRPTRRSRSRRSGSASTRRSASPPASTRTAKRCIGPRRSSASATSRSAPSPRIAQPGNDKPRLFRLIPDRAVINRMGFNNHGARRRRRPARRACAAPTDRPVLGVNIGKSRVVAVEDATADYLTSARALAPVADYLVVNVSSPNTPGLRGLQELDLLAPLLTAVKEVAGRRPAAGEDRARPDRRRRSRRSPSSSSSSASPASSRPTRRSPATGLRTDPAVVEAAGAGGLSGAPLAARSLEVLRLIRVDRAGRAVRHLGRRRRDRRRCRRSGWMPGRRWCRATRRSSTAARSGPQINRGLARDPAAAAYAAPGVPWWKRRRQRPSTRTQSELRSVAAARIRSCAR